MAHKNDSAASLSLATSLSPAASTTVTTRSVRSDSATASLTPATTASMVSESLSPIGPSSASSSCYSPGMDAIGRMTPLPSPLASCESPGPWNQFRGLSRNPSVTRGTPVRPSLSSRGNSALVTSSGESLDTALAAQNQRITFQALRPPPAPAQPQFSFNGTTGQKLDFESTLPIPIRRSLSKNGGHERSPSLPVFDASTKIHREKCLAQRRRTLSSADSSPYLSGSVTSLSSVSSMETCCADPDEKSVRLIRKQKLESFEAKSTRTGRVKRWRGMRLIGQGAFSKVILATSEDIPDEVDQVHDEGVVVDDEPVTLNPRKYVAVKIIEHGAAGTESKERVESGLKRELDILMSVHHPCLVRLKAFNIEPSRALLVLNFCAGGDLFDVATDYSIKLRPRLIRRIFAEIVSAVRYLHQNGIVHRDVKLENVLVNLTRPQLNAVSDSPFDYPHPIITLTDVGLSRRVDFEKDDLLTTRCGSDDYAAPELIMGQPYDGRSTDAWALGVLLYALLEGQLPFDPPPDSSEKKMRSKTAHKIARCEWKWVKLAAPGYDEQFEGGKRIVMSLLKRALKRWKLDAVCDDEWVKNAITVPLQEIEE
ncbi:kinase-like domain-containing protein [Tricharina praecox]|uniref:kinase-like domain-containing protein n=1 Tax=Tricharina praecox TaxID=43433 RepID=UPI00221EF1EF|nr:kinase-like domain-containing protein [Tricharina praecox]KAI5849070.1 kinase-like domain-containing protein [Tricharina praecox]